MRRISLDTETTGLKSEDGHRLIELAGVEILNGVDIGESFHRLVNPQREVEEDARKIHGMSLRDLKDKPLFEEIVDDFLEFIGDSELVIHNAAFDLGFLNNELKLCGRPSLTNAAHDTVTHARRRWPRANVSLDALCKRFGVDNTDRKLHGALIDAHLLAQVYIEMTNERAPSLDLSPADGSREQAAVASDGLEWPRRPAIEASREEIEEHKQFVASKLTGNTWGY